MTPNQTIRLRLIHEILSDDAWPIVMLVDEVNRQLIKRELPPASKRQIHDDVNTLRGILGDKVLRKVRAGDCADDARAASGHRSFYRIQGAEDMIIVGRQVSMVSESQLLALQLAQSILRSPIMPWQQPADVAEGPLAEAIRLHREQLGLDASSMCLAEDMVSHYATGVEAWESDHLLQIFRAIRLGEALRMSYQGAGQEAPSMRRVKPIRLILSGLDWYFLAWSPTDPDGMSSEGKVKEYKVARIMELGPTVLRCRLPSGLDSEARSLAAGSFNGMAGDRDRRVVLRIHRSRWAQVLGPRGRSWGRRQCLEDIDADWKRLSFTTAGVEAVAGWLLGLGGGVVVEAPTGLRDDVVRRAQAVMAMQEDMAAVG